MSDSHVVLEDASAPLTDERAKHEKPALDGLRPMFALLAALLIAGGILIGVGQYRLLHRDDSSSGPSDPLARALWLMDRHILIDGHNDLAWQYREARNLSVFSESSFDLRSNCSAAGLQTDIPKIRRGKLGGQFWSVFVLCGMPDAVRATMEEISIVKSFVAKYSDTFQMVYSADEVDVAFKAGRVASLMGMEGGHSIDSSLGALRMFHELGVRYMTLTHACNTAWAESCCDPATYPPTSLFNVTGLSKPTAGAPAGQMTGLDVVREMNRVGMIVDLSHVSDATMRDALATSVAPVMFSHSGAKALVPHERNVPDDVLRTLAANDGVIMIPFINQFIQNATDALAYTTAARVADHFDHVRNVTGSARHLGIGADFEGDDGPKDFPVDLYDVGMYPTLIAELIRRGYTDEEVVGILGGNVVRVLRAVEEVAAGLQAPGQPAQGEKRIVYEDSCRSDF